VTDVTITFSPPLPCCTVITPDERCNKPATVGTISPLGAGNLILQPFCRECVAKLQTVYGPAGELFPSPGPPTLRIIGRDQRHEGEPSEDPRSGWLNMSNGEEIP
jgi:hypothetical protein